MKISQPTQEERYLHQVEGKLTRLRRQMAALREHWKTVNIVMEVLEARARLPDEDLYEAAEVWFELSDEEQIALYSVSPRDGGFWTTEERTILQSQEFRESYYGKPGQDYEIETL